jgi:tetratricopeptide (TPR) repeat protein
MSLEFYRKLTQFFGILALGVLFALIAFSSVVEIKDLDLWLHMKMGEVITTTGQVPSHDILSGTIAGKPWINHEWLFQTVVYSVRTAFGLDGLLYMQAFLVLLAFTLLLLWTYRRDRQLVILPLLFYVLQVYQTRFTVRPDIFSVVFFILFLIILITSIERRWSLFVLFLLQVVWGNMHGFFVWGPILVMTFLVAETFKRYAPLPQGWRDEGRLSDEGYQRLGIGFLVVLAAMLVNPMTFQGAIYPLKVLVGLSGDNQMFFKFITELQPSIKAATLWDLGDQMPFKTLIIVSAISFVLNIRKINLGLFLVWAMVLFFSISAVRNMIYFAIIAYAATLINVSRLDLNAIIPVRFMREEFELLTGWLVKLGIIFFLLNYGGDMAQFGYYDFNKYERKSEFLGVAQRTFPEGAVDFVVKNKIAGPVFNDFNSGAYLVGRAYPAIRVFMDGRTEVYGAKFFKGVYNKIWEDGDEKVFDEAVARYHLKAAVIGAAFSRPSEKFLKMFVGRKDWKLVYFDHDGLVFLRDIPENAALIREFGIDFKTWKAPVSDIHRTASAKVTPYRESNRAVMLVRMGYFDQALEQADAALAVSPAWRDAFEVKGQVYADRKDHVKAFENYRLALLQDSGDVRLRRGLALAYVGLGEYDHALEQADRLDEVVGDPSGPYVRAKVFVKKKQYEKAYDILVKYVFPLGKGLAEIVAIGDFCVEDKAYDWAVKAYALAVRKDDKDMDVLKKLKDAQLKMRGAQ